MKWSRGNTATFEVKCFSLSRICGQLGPSVRLWITGCPAVRHGSGVRHQGGTFEAMSANPPDLGPESRGPDFAPPSYGGPPPPGPYQPGPYQQGQPQPPYGTAQPISGRPGQPYPPRTGAPQPPQPPRPDRRPAIITAVVIGVVVLVVVIASIHAIRGDQQAAHNAASPSATPRPSALPSDNPNSISFTSSEGSGRLTLVSHSWTTSGAVAPRYGQFLRLKLKISASDGHVSYGPEFFQTFDSTGNLFQTTEVGATAPLLGEGVLQPGQSTTGDIAFDMPRGAVTLLMSNSLLESVTALRINS